MTRDEPKQPVPFGEAFRVWLKIGLLSFGGPSGQIALMHRVLVEEKRWVADDRFLHALSFCMLLPGPEAQQLAVYVGWLLHKAKGGLVAGLLFVLPGALVILLLSVLYAGFGELKLVQAVFFGIKAAVLAIVVEALSRIARRALKTAALYALAGAAFVAIFFLAVPFPLIVLVAGLLGYAAARLAPQLLPAANGSSAADSAGVAGPRGSLTRSLGLLAIFLPLWLGPIGLLALLLGGDHVFVVEGLLFSKLAVVTFGGAYAVLAYVAQEAVTTYAWLQPGEMLDGLGLAETTPGPLIMVLQFVGFLAAHRNPGGLDPMLAGSLGALITTWVTFVPCFLWIFLGAPYIEALRGNRALAGALTAITAAVVGVILNLAVWFALHVLFGEVGAVTAGPVHLLVPDLATIEPVAALLAVAALVAMFRFKLGMLPTLAGCALVGGLYAGFAL